MLCLADFTLDSDMRLPDGGAPFTINGPDGSTLTIANNKEGLARSNEVLSAQLILQADNLEHARELAQDKLATFLNAFCFATNRLFVQSRLKRVVDWTPGLKERDILVMHAVPKWELAEPALDDGYFKSVERVAAMQLGERLQTALRWYRLGLRSEIPEEQFSYFWFSLEIAAELAKDEVKVTSPCPTCQTALYCEKCNTHPVHRKFASDAIRQIITQVAPKQASAEELFATLQKIRHTLMHGRRIHSVIDSLPCTEDQAINALARITWHAMWLSFDEDKDPSPHETLNFGYTDNVIRSQLVATAHMTIGVHGDPNNPTIADVPVVETAILYDGEEVPAHRL